MTLLATPLESRADEALALPWLAEAAGCTDACRFWCCTDDPAHPSFTLLHHHRETEPHRLPAGVPDASALATAVEWLRSFH
jgi:hypothetical protein